MTPEPHPHPVGRFILLWVAACLIAAATPGCLEPEEGDDPEDPETGEASPPSSNETVPEPLTFSGTATIAHPAHFAACAGGGIDGAFHELTTDTGGWNFQVEPADSFVVYWWEDGEYMEGGEPHGKVPGGATHAEVCYADGTGPSEYTLTLIHPDHVDA